ncbi:MAG: hypothetical protein J6M44_10250 [Butyrivibrio sp.]|uniref:hypothetical protein n=1 Tax=Butyrivibrio sp. TaxID=28121 RepID=UPI001B6D7B46|nr:hypothetical protein [Butyrivibrio sp.]MBP3279323.1 hypothetical protein [Butyrivibrio sp.]MBP3782093.1 hypothetical protein [Butyrivibrio sp.]
MKESAFYDVIDKMEEIDVDTTKGYYPTIADLEEYKVEQDIDLFLPILAYYASDPFKRMNIKPDNPNEYKATVKYCKDVLSRIKLT